MKVVYEPWGLGDACIAASVAVESDDTILACRTSWHDVITTSIRRTGKDLKLLSADLDYGVRQPSDANGIKSKQTTDEPCSVFSVRGDPRDYYNIYRSFKGAKIKMTGWLISLARRVSIVDFLLKRLRPVQSRYLQWARCLGVDPSLLKSATPLPSKITRVGIHIGAQWKSKQYPFVGALREQLISRGIEVVVFASTKDPIPEGLQENIVLRCIGAEMVNQLATCDVVVTNDSGPMHVCYVADIPFLAICGTSNAREWVPPGGAYIAAKFMPSGYKSVSTYASDQVLDGWPEADAVVNLVRSKRGAKTL